MFLYAYESKWLFRKLKAKKFKTLYKFNHCSRFIDDLLCLNNDGLMDSAMHEIYPKELMLTSDDAILRSHYLDLDLEIRDGKFFTKLYDKRDAFNFHIVNFPDLSGNIPTKHSYGVFVSQLIRYARCCEELVDFTTRSKTLIKKLVKQNYKIRQLKRVFEKFLTTHFELLYKFRQPISNICTRCY